ncbi:hypothetical protein [Leptotrichia trevisanii]|uniref:hypothetical protein n=1 Tax=Leptotrichia trevisanii TaxID=109328 RepID=UPI0004057420|nr:hypothetical protein [Leptotrichia trevisanii]
MDVKLNNATGELYVEKGDIQFFGAKEKYFEVIQQIVLMLHIREGELEYDIKYGLNFEKLFGTHGNENEVLEHIRDKIYNNFKDYLSRCYVEVYEYENRHLKVNIGLIFNDNKSALMKGVGIGWRE